MNAITGPDLTSRVPTDGVLSSPSLSDMGTNAVKTPVKLVGIRIYGLETDHAFEFFSRQSLWRLRVRSFSGITYQHLTIAQAQ